MQGGLLSEAKAFNLRSDSYVSNQSVKGSRQLEKSSAEEETS